MTGAGLDHTYINDGFKDDKFGECQPLHRKGMTNIESVTPVFEVKKIVLLATKSETLEIVTEEITDMILGREEVKTK